MASLQTIILWTAPTPANKEQKKKNKYTPIQRWKLISTNANRVSVRVRMWLLACTWKDGYLWEMMMCVCVCVYVHILIVFAANTWSTFCAHLSRQNLCCCSASLFFVCGTARVCACLYEWRINWITANIIIIGQGTNYGCTFVVDCLDDSERMDDDESHFLFSFGRFRCRHSKFNSDCNSSPLLRKPPSPPLPYGPIQ